MILPPFSKYQAAFSSSSFKVQGNQKILRNNEYRKVGRTNRLGVVYHWVERGHSPTKYNNINRSGNVGRTIGNSVPRVKRRRTATSRCCVGLLFFLLRRGGEGERRLMGPRIRRVHCKLNGDVYIMVIYVTTKRRGRKFGSRV